MWLPQLILCVLLIISSTISRIFLRKKSNSGDEDSKYLYGDVFILTTIDKLLSIGYNGHLIIFFLTRRDIDIAYMIIPVLVFLFHLSVLADDHCRQHPRY